MRHVLGALAVAVAMAWAVPAQAADCSMQGGQCPMMQQMKHDGREKADDCGCPITGKTIEKAKFLLKHADEIGLSEEQAQTITGIKMEAKKAAIRQKAEMEIFQMDIQAKMSEPQLDVDGLNQMIDGAASGMTTGAKSMVATYAKLRAVLSEAQVVKAKELWKKSQ